MSSISLQSHHLIHDHCFGRATKRLYNEYKKYVESPPENIKVAFQEDLILDWHFLFTGLIDTPFKGGQYHGMLIFPEDYPFSPPSIRFITPNGRFKTDERVCFDLSDFHSECWKPANTVSVVLEGVYSFMMTETTDTVGSLVMDDTLIRSLARKSKDFNRKDKICNALFHNQFTSNLDRTNSYSNTKITHTSAIQPNYSDEQNDSSESSPNILRVQTCISGTNTNSEFESANLFPEKQTLSPECTTFNTLDSSRPENPKSSEFGEIPTSKSRLNISEVPRSNLSMKRTKRISKEFQKIMDNPIHNIIVTPGKDLILEWHFLFTGLNDTPFKGGQYHGMLIFPEDYPFSPPSIRFITPNGRFNANERICFELSDFRSECWKPAYTVSAVLQGVYSFMMSETTDAVGSLEMDENEIRELARKSKEFNLKDGSAELFQNEKVALTENSDTDPTPSPINKPDISSQKDQSCSSPDLLEPDVSSKAVETSEITDIVGSLNVDENDINNPAEMSKAFYLNDSSAVFFKNEIMNGSNVDTNPRLNEKIRKNYIPSPRKIKSSSLPDTLKPTVSSKESQKTRDLASASSASFPDEKVSKIRNTRKNDEDISSRSQINKINSKTPRIDLQKETIASRDGKKLDKYKCTSIYHNSTNNPKVQSRPLSQKEEIGAQNFKMLKSIDIPRPKLENKYIISPFKYQ